jgi:hypothetical protein
MPNRRKRLSKNDFERRVKIFGLLVPIATALLTTATTLYVVERRDSRSLASGGFFSGDTLNSSTPSSTATKQVPDSFARTAPETESSTPRVAVHNMSATDQPATDLPADERERLEARIEELQAELKRARDPQGATPQATDARPEEELAAKVGEARPTVGTALRQVSDPGDNIGAGQDSDPRDDVGAVPDLVGRTAGERLRRTAAERLRQEGTLRSRVIFRSPVPPVAPPPASRSTLPLQTTVFLASLFASGLIWRAAFRIIRRRRSAGDETVLASEIG